MTNNLVSRNTYYFKQDDKDKPLPKPVEVPKPDTSLNNVQERGLSNDSNTVLKDNKNKKDG